MLRTRSCSIGDWQMGQKTMSPQTTHPDRGLQIVWYHAQLDVIFQSGELEGLFCALAIRPDWWAENPHIVLVGLI